MAVDTGETSQPVHVLAWQPFVVMAPVIGGLCSLKQDLLQSQVGETLPAEWRLSDIESNMLVLGAGVLQQGRAYKFRARALAVDLSSVVGHADVAVVVNSGPQNRFDEFTVSPSTGVAMRTVFVLDAGIHWTDVEEDMPLNYAFGYTSNGRYELLTSSSVLSSTTASLPAGDANSAYALAVAVQVSDSLGSSTFSERLVRVDRPASSAAALSTLVSERLTAAADSGDVDALLQACAATAIATAQLEADSPDQETFAATAELHNEVISALDEASSSFHADHTVTGWVASMLQSVITPAISPTSLTGGLGILHRILPGVDDGVALDGPATNAVFGCADSIAGLVVSVPTWVAPTASVAAPIVSSP